MRHAGLVSGALVFTVLIGERPAHAEHLFPAGAESKATGMPSVVGSRGAPATLYNPANLAARDAAGGFQPYLELGLLNVDYYYEHPEFDPVQVKVTTPTATVGASQRLPAGFTLGAVAFPTESGTTEIPGLPRRVGDQTRALMVSAKDDSMDVGAGLGLALPAGVAAGVALVRTIESHTMSASLVGNDRSLVELEYRNQFDRPVAGVSWTGGWLDLACAYRPAQVKNYEGTQSTAGDDATAPKVVDFEPVQIQAGATVRAGPFSLGAEVARHRWSAGADVVKDGVNNLQPRADLHDVTHTSVTAGWRPGGPAEVSLGFARLPSPWGEGRHGATTSEALHGVDFGMLDGIDRKVYAGGGRMRLGKVDLSASAFYAGGERQVSDAGEATGYFTLDMLSVSGGVGASF